MKMKLFAALFVAAVALSGCSSDDAGSDGVRNGSVSIELPEINNTANRLGVSDIALFVLQITSDSIEYSDTIESETGGIVTIEKLAEARYEITVDAFDADGDVILTGANFANVFVGEVTYAQIDLNFTSGELDIEVILPGEDLIGTLEISGVFLDDSEEITVVHGPGILIERLLGGSFTYIPGLASMKVFSIETGGNNVVTLQSWFDGLQEPRSGSLIVNDLTGSESYRWNMFEMTPLFYQESSEDQTQFYFSILIYEVEGFVSGLAANYDQSADKGIEISGITPEDMAAKVRDDVSNNTLTLTFGYEAGLRELYLWMMNFVDGIADIRSMTVITYGAGGFGDEVSRRNYFEVFPLSFEQINGFQIDVKGQFRVVLSYEFSEDAV